MRTKAKFLVDMFNYCNDKHYDEVLPFLNVQKALDSFKSNFIF